MSASPDRSSYATAQQSHDGQPRYYFGAKNIQRVRDSTLLTSSQEEPDSSESTYSDERSICNAIKVTSSNEDRRSHESAYYMGPALEDGLARHIAMFIPLDSSSGSRSTTPHRHPKRTGRREGQVWWRTLMLSDHGPQRPKQPASDPSNDTMEAAVPEVTSDRRRNAFSLAALDMKGFSPTWPRPLAPAVRVHQPPYPPLQRMPTPPGLPSFNTPEAVYYSAQFLGAGNGGHSDISHPPNTNSPSSWATSWATSYSDAFRRFFGLPTPTELTNRRSVAGIGRADDGTIVQGRFPHRQSGHGIGTNRRLEDHPFHQIDLPSASLAEEGTSADADSEVASAKHSNLHSDRGPQLSILPSAGRPRPSSGDPLQSALPQSAAQRSRRLGNFAATSGIQHISPRQGTITSAATPTTSQIDSAQVLGAPYRRLPPSPLQSVLVQDSPNATDEEHTKEIPTVSEILAWLAVRFYMCCCLGYSCLHRFTEAQDPLEVTTSRETYTTARTRISAEEGSQSTGKTLLSSLIAPVYGLFHSCPRTPAQSTAP